MIVLLTDFGLHGPYTGQMKAVLHQAAPGVPVIDLFADAPVATPKQQPTCCRPMPDGSRSEPSSCVSLTPASAGHDRPLFLRLTAGGTSALGTASSSWSSAGPGRRAAGTLSGSQSASQPAFMDGTSSHQSQPCWREASRRPVRCARIVRTAGPTGPMTFARSSTSITSAMA